jgi:hypothetical protein
MSDTPEADYGPFDANLRLRRHSWTPIVFIFGGLDLTGWTAPVFRWGQSIATGVADGTVAGVLTPGANSTVSVTLSRASFWTPLGNDRSGDWELALSTPSDVEPVALVSGTFQVESSFLP